MTHGAVREFLDSLRKWADNTTTAADHDDVIRSAAWWRAYDRLRAALEQDESDARQGVTTMPDPFRPIEHPAGELVGFMNYLRGDGRELHTVVFGRLVEPILEGDPTAVVALVDGEDVTATVPVHLLDFSKAGLVDAADFVPRHLTRVLPPEDGR